MDFLNAAYDNYNMSGLFSSHRPTCQSVKFCKTGRSVFLLLMQLFKVQHGGRPPSCIFDMVHGANSDTRAQCLIYAVKFCHRLQVTKIILKFSMALCAAIMEFENLNSNRSDTLGLFFRNLSVKFGRIVLE